MESLGIIKVESVHWYVKDLERTRRFYTQLMDFAELGESSPELTAGAGRSVAFQAGELTLVCSAPQSVRAAGLALAAQAPRGWAP